MQAINTDAKFSRRILFFFFPFLLITVSLSNKTSSAFFKHSCPRRRQVLKKNPVYFSFNFFSPLFSHYDFELFIVKHKQKRTAGGKKKLESYSQTFDHVFQLYFSLTPLRQYVIFILGVFKPNYEWKFDHVTSSEKFRDVVKKKFWA